MTELTYVLACAVIGWAALGLYLFRVDRRLRRLEREFPATDNKKKD